MKKAFKTKKEKKELELFTRELIPVSKIAENFGVAQSTVYKELKNGMEEEEYKARRYIKYSAEKSFEKTLKEIQGE